MISRLKSWIARVANERSEAVPTVVSHNSPIISIYKIGNGYIYHKGDNRPYRGDDAVPNVIYCANILDVCRQMVNKEALEKLGIKSEAQDADANLHTHGYASVKLDIKTTPI
jgi:hypothetical protein